MGLNTLGGVEVRVIILAQGIQAHSKDMAPCLHIPGALTTPRAERTDDWPRKLKNYEALPIQQPQGLPPEFSNGFSYLSSKQMVLYVLLVVTTKDEFKRALEMPGVHVVYAGHARYGRGPCFGATDAPGEDWENGANATTSGLFRMGFPYLSVPASEVLAHGYTADLVPATTALLPEDCEPTLRKSLVNLRPALLAEINPLLVGHVSNPDPTIRWWTYRAVDDGPLEPFVVLHAGWRQTASAPMDLDATQMNCRVFCHFGCSTMDHNQPILRNPARKGWRNEGDNRFAYFTTGLSGGYEVAYWLYHLFTYPKHNAYSPWGPSLAYAVQQTNADLGGNGGDNLGYQII